MGGFGGRPKKESCLRSRLSAKVTASRLPHNKLSVRSPDSYTVTCDHAFLLFRNLWFIFCCRKLHQKSYIFYSLDYIASNTHLLVGSHLDKNGHGKTQEAKLKWTYMFPSKMVVLAIRVDIGAQKINCQKKSG